MTNLKGLLASALVATSVFPSTLALPVQETDLERRSGTSSEQITYVLPIWEGALASHSQNDDLAVLNDMKSRLGTGGQYTKLGWSFSSWALSRDSQGASSDYQFDPTNLNYMLGLAKTAGLPALVHMNNGRWADCCTPNSSGGWGNLLLDYIAAQPDTQVLDTAGQGQYAHNGGNNYFTLSRLNTVYRSYKKRNVQASASVIATWAAANPSLFAGVSLDSETFIPNASTDFNPLAIEEWRQWLQNTGIYGPNGAFFGTGRLPAFTSISTFNAQMGTNFASFSAIQPPTAVTPGNPFYEEWARWRVLLVAHHVSDETLWIAQAGIDRTAIYGHQTPRLDDYQHADSIDTFTAANGGGGVTNYGWNPSDFGEINNAMRGVSKNNWGNFELNPLTNDATTSYNTMVTMYNDGIKIVCPNSWENETTKDQYALFGSPNYGDTFGNAVARFLSDYGSRQRNTQPPATNPGTKVYDLYDQFSSATKSGPDNRLVATGSVGNAVRKSIFSHVSGTLTYTVSLPSVSSSQRLNFWTSLGVQDGAGANGGEAVFQATINGANLFGRGLHLNKNYWSWKRWVPMMVDVTPWAGQQVTLTLTTTGSDTYGWTMWGSPAIYQSSSTNNNLALGKTVTVSSQDGMNSGWNPTYLADGNVDGGTNGRNGWSSVSHSSATETEWAQVDIGATQAVGKVVLFPRSDLIDFEGSGFPSNFIIQGSTDGATFTTLLTAVDYSASPAGYGEVFTFPSAQARYVRVTASRLGGVGNESGFRFQMTEMEVYA
ncbi:uncharacterized protein A1O9_01119 [Exophiala aquamarina CBS 119918]|uniref:F5/8 type C domain-containing protein n=1 Tax=Exophiala aquamarina CBS 119918 TaxID=1182545 RepID=A0A072PUV4_9EURO|nr:uncharacterized protein A1O9_01119 [Exophiala aquamarina CBS 119918]KEF63143.1 hypothetical protein A1O9_01119 [Exophiala aquamarina CBS 119918]